MTTPTAEECRQQLRRVVDPCSIAMCAPVDICDMGLVEDIDITEGRVQVTLVLTDVSCAFYRDLRRHVIDVLLEMPGVDAAEVRLSTDVLWTPDRRRHLEEGRR